MIFSMDFDGVILLLTRSTGLKRGRPLFLNKHRYNALKQLYLKHRVAQEVSTIRASSDRVIRENYY